MTMKFPKIRSQKGHILYKLLNNEAVINKDLTVLLNTSNPGARICELRADGWFISDRIINSETSEKKYFLESYYLDALKENERIQNFISSAEKEYIH